jgi:2-dehydropantoate 2-reductase
MRIAVFGVGAIGGHIAARLAAKGHDVGVVARGETLEALERNGLTLKSGTDTFNAPVRVAAGLAELGAQDVVITTVKATAPAALAEGLAPIAKAATPVVFVQNGIPWWYPHGLAPGRPKPPDLSKLDPGGALARTIPLPRIFGGVINSSNEMDVPGVVTNSSPGKNALVIKAADNRDAPEIAPLLAALSAAGIATPPAADIRKDVWRKLLVNLSGSTLCFLTGHKATMVNHDPRLAALFVRNVAETKAIAAAHGIDLSELDPKAMLKNLPHHLPSIRQDYDRGRAVELESMMMAPLAFARAAGVETPSLDAIAALAVRQAIDKGLYSP